jgi:hypothetical protein
LLATSELGLQCVGDCFRYFALDTKDINELAIVGLSPQMRIAGRPDQLDIDAHLIGRFLNAAFQDVRHAKLLRDLKKIFRRAFVMLG